MDSQFSVTAVLFHGDHKIASAGTGDGYVQHVSVCACLETLKWKILQVVLMHCRDKVHYYVCNSLHSAHCEIAFLSITDVHVYLVTVCTLV